MYRQGGLKGPAQVNTHVGAELVVDLLRLLGLVVAGQLIEDGARPTAAVVVAGGSLRVQIAVGVGLIVLAVGVPSIDSSALHEVHAWQRKVMDAAEENKWFSFRILHIKN